MANYIDHLFVLIGHLDIFCREDVCLGPLPTFALYCLLILFFYFLNKNKKYINNFIKINFYKKIKKKKRQVSSLEAWEYVQVIHDLWQVYDLGESQVPGLTFPCLWIKGYLKNWDILLAKYLDSTGPEYCKLAKYALDFIVRNVTLLSILFLRYIPKRKENICPCENLYMNVYSIVI